MSTLQGRGGQRKRDDGERRRRHGVIRWVGCALIVGMSIISTGCVQIIALGALTGAGEYARYQMATEAQRTMMGSLNRISEYAVNTLVKMKFNIMEMSEEDEKTRILATAKELNIDVRLDSITENTVKVSVNASKQLFKDRATAEEIIEQIDLLAAAVPHQ